MTIVKLTIYFLVFTFTLFTGEAGLRRIRKLGAKLQRIEHLIHSGHFAQASTLAEDIVTSISPSAEDAEIKLIFLFVNQSLSHYVPLIGSEHETVESQIGLNIYVKLLQKICRKDHLHDPETRLLHRIRLQELVISILKGIERQVSRSYHRYHDKYRELQRIISKMDELYVKLVDPVPCRWMRLMNDAATLQKVQPRKDGIVYPYYDGLIDHLYTRAIRLFVGEMEALRRARGSGDAVYSEMFSNFQWIADALPVVTALEYCVSLSRRAHNNSEVERFQNFSRMYYYDRLAVVHY